MKNNLAGKRTAFLATDGVEQSELSRPWDDAIKEAGADDLDAFCVKTIEEFSEGRHEGQTA